MTLESKTPVSTAMPTDANVSDAWQQTGWIKVSDFPI
jgi:hypothetical protein